jgi:hypothetical protein
MYFLHDVPELQVPRGLTVRISGFHPEGPGSTPGVGTVFFRCEESEKFLICSQFSHNIHMYMCQNLTCIFSSFLCRSLAFLKKAVSRIALDYWRYEPIKHK